MRFYRNGVLIKDGWTPYSMESPMEEAKTISLGSNGRAHGFVDLDEVAIFNRALSANEVKLLASGRRRRICPGSPRQNFDGALLVRRQIDHAAQCHHQFDLKGNHGKAQVTRRHSAATAKPPR